MATPEIEEFFNLQDSPIAEHDHYATLKVYDNWEEVQVRLDAKSGNNNTITAYDVEMRLYREGDGLIATRTGYVHSESPFDRDITPVYEGTCWLEFHFTYSQGGEYYGEWNYTTDTWYH
ncbi:hypothetical protein CHL76_02140 [Marinococcus halophilus]|uniref:Uncharacterized protein n=1 Tax=Marinococcus halophilus TaxID=1371 RepID=A0A510Y3D9_MARHA|nr:hypothetical protein [Marinococcus halophilus]OZT81177.1 hypothetical protein CHL76_02140 [Marinococcus halophilus]GEK57107.1 hypothetical protein MHA01_00120 [Marinococcus halophilus]